MVVPAPVLQQVGPAPVSVVLLLLAQEGASSLLLAQEGASMCQVHQMVVLVPVPELPPLPPCSAPLGTPLQQA